MYCIEIHIMYLPSCQHMSIEAQPGVITDALHDNIHRWEGLPCHDEKFKVHRGARANGIYGSDARIVDLIRYKITDINTSSIARASQEGTHQRGV